MICMPRNFMSQRESRHQRVDDREEVVVDLVELAELGLEVAQEDLDVAGLVHDLRGAVELAVEPVHRLGDLADA